MLKYTLHYKFIMIRYLKTCITLGYIEAKDLTKVILMILMIFKLDIFSKTTYVRSNRENR